MAAAGPRIVLSRMTAYRVPDAAALEQKCFSRPWSAAALREELNSPHARFAAVTVDGAFAGYAGWLTLSGEAELLRIAVDPAFRRQGLGDALLAAVLDGAREAGAGTVFLEVRESNAPAVALYRKHGFRPVGRRPDYYDAPVEAALLFSADLTAPARPDGPITPSERG